MATSDEIGRDPEDRECDGGDVPELSETDLTTPDDYSMTAETRKKADVVLTAGSSGITIDKPNDSGIALDDSDITVNNATSDDEFDPDAPIDFFDDGHAIGYELNTRPEQEESDDDPTILPFKRRYDEPDHNK